MTKLSIATSLAWVLSSVAFVTASSNAAAAFISPEHRRSMATTTAVQHRTRFSFLSPSATDAFQLCSSTSLRSSVEDLKEEINSMRAGAIKKELESMGISTRGFFDKGELVNELVRAVMEGKTPGAAASSNAASSPSPSPSPSASSASASPAPSNADPQRAGFVAKEFERTTVLGLSELKQKLESYGVNTASYTEHKDFAQALAEIRVDQYLNLWPVGKEDPRMKWMSGAMF